MKLTADETNRNSTNDLYLYLCHDHYVYGLCVHLRSTCSQFSTFLLSFRGFFDFELSRRVFAFPPPPFFILLLTRGKKRCGKKLVALNFEKEKTNRYRRYSGHIYKVYRVDRIVRMMHSREDGMEILSRRETGTRMVGEW